LLAWPRITGVAAPPEPGRRGRRAHAITPLAGARHDAEGKAHSSLYCQSRGRFWHHSRVSFNFIKNYIVPASPDSPAQRSCAHPDQTFHGFRLIIKPSTKQMANRSRLVQISSKKDDSSNRFSKGAVKEEMLNILIPVTTDAFLTTLPIFPSQIVFG
jgi:hypothetical protein